MNNSSHLFFLPVLISLSLYSHSSLAEGGSSAGNGGDAVVCRKSDGTILSVELLDYYEARTLRGINQDLGPPLLAVEAKLNIALSRLDKQSPQRALLYRKQAQNFAAEARYLRGTDLVDIPDSGHIIFPNHCKVEQIAIQKEPEFPQDKHYLINGDLWDYLSNNSKAGLILHEIIYREVIPYHHPDSKRVRYFNSMLASSEFPSESFQDFLKLLQFTWMDAVEIGENVFSLYKEKKPNTIPGIWISPVDKKRYDLHLDNYGRNQLKPIPFAFGEVDASQSGIYRFDEADSLLEIRYFGKSFRLYSNATSETLWEVRSSGGWYGESSSLLFRKDSNTKYGRLLKWVNAPDFEKTVINKKTGLKFTTTGDLEFSEDYQTIRVLGPNATITFGNAKIILPNPESTFTFHSDSLQNESHDVQITFETWIGPSGGPPKELGAGCFAKGKPRPFATSSVDLEPSSRNELSMIKNFELTLPLEVYCQVLWAYSSKPGPGQYPDGYAFTAAPQSRIALGARGEIIRAKTITDINFYDLATEPFPVRLTYAQYNGYRGCRGGSICTHPPGLYWRKVARIERGFEREPKNKIHFPAGTVLEIATDGRIHK